MKVVKQGRPQTGWAKEFTCTGGGNGGGGCGAELLVEEGDLFRTQSSARDETTTHTTFRCPECGVNTDIGGVPPTDEPYLPLKGLAVSGRGGGGRLSRLALIPLLLAGLEAEERRQR